MVKRNVMFQCWRKSQGRKYNRISIVQRGTNAAVPQMESARFLAKSENPPPSQFGGGAGAEGVGKEG